MKTHKTWTRDRGSFTYEFLDGSKIRLSPGRDGVTEADIAALHRMDDREVENNNEQIKPPLQKWQKTYMEEWMCRHPGEKVPGRINVSLDTIPDPDITDTARKGDPVLSLCSMAVQEQEAVSAETEAVRGFVQKFLTDTQRMIYQRVLIEGESMTSVANDLGIRKQSVYERVQYIKKVFKNNFKLFLNQTDI